VPSLLVVASDVGLVAATLALWAQRWRRSDHRLFAGLVTEINTDTELDTSSVRNPGIPCGHFKLNSTAQRTASTTLANSTRRPSPVVLTMRPRCSLILGSARSEGFELRFAVNYLAGFLLTLLLLPLVACYGSKREASAISSLSSAMQR
jgi:transposase-like protein